MNGIDVPIRTLYRDLGGELPKRGNYVTAFWRGSTDSNVQLVPDKNIYVDHARGSERGGTVKLVMTCLRVDRLRARQYLEQNYGDGRIPAMPTRAEWIEEQNAELFRQGWILLLDEVLRGYSILRDGDRKWIGHYTGIRMHIAGASKAVVLKEYRECLRNDPEAAKARVERAQAYRELLADMHAVVGEIMQCEARKTA